MQDKSKNISIAQPKMIKLHGHTTIELHNHRTGSRERIEHDNEFTDAMEKYMKSYGVLTNNPFSNDTWRSRSLYQNLVGGILLFDSEIEKVGGKYPLTMPAGVKMVANGSYGVANNSAVTEMGTFNTNESTFGQNALTFIYDWSTSQGNGEIACVSLTSDIGGYIGYGNASSDSALYSADYDFTENQTIVQKSIYSGIENAVVVIKGNDLYYVKNEQLSEQTFDIYHRSLPISSLSLFDGFETLHKTVTIPSSVTYYASNNRKIYAASNDEFLVVPTVASGTFTIGKYKISTNTWQTYSITSSESINLNYLRCWEGGFGTEYQRYTYGDVAFETSSIRINTSVPISNDLRIVYAGYNSPASPAYIHDDLNNTDFKINTRFYSSFDAFTLSASDPINLWTQTKDAGSYTRPTYVYSIKNPLYLATVNNLDEPITKTPETSMKVTYTIVPEEP